MRTPHSWSRRQFLATSGLSLLPTLQQSSAETSAPSLDWSHAYSRDQTSLADIAPAHTDGWVAVGEDTKNYNTLIVSVATDGTARWQKIRTDVPLREALSIVQRDEGYAVAGRADGDDPNNGPYLTLVDTQGTIETTTVVSAIGDLHYMELSQTDQGGYILAGGIDFPERFSTLVCGFDADGRHQWTRRYEEKYEFKFIVQSSDDSYIIGGNQAHEGNLWLAEITVDGDEQWKSTVSTSWSFGASAAVRGHEGKILIAGYDYSANEDVFVWLTSEREIDRIQRQDVGGFAFERIEDGYISASTIDSDQGDSIRLTHVDADLNVLWTQVYDVEARVEAFLNQGTDGFVFAGSTGPAQTAWIGKISDSPMQPATTQNSSAVPNRTAATLHGQNTSTTNSSESTSDTTPGFGLLTATTGLAAVLWGYYLNDTE